MEVMNLLRNACYLKVALSGLTNEIDGRRTPLLCTSRSMSGSWFAGASLRQVAAGARRDAGRYPRTPQRNRNELGGTTVNKTWR
jgi:hypothetical protein